MMRKIVTKKNPKRRWPKRLRFGRPWSWQSAVARHHQTRLSHVLVPREPWTSKRKIVSSAHGSLLRLPFGEQ